MNEYARSINLNLNQLRVCSRLEEPMTSINPRIPALKSLTLTLNGRQRSQETLYVLAIRSLFWQIWVNRGKPCNLERDHIE